MQIPQNPTKVLVVDDDVHAQSAVKALLETGGYEVQLAGGGREGLKSFFQDPPDIAILDAHMPGMDGVTLLKRIREVSSTTPLIMLTALNQDQLIVDALESGADDFIVKPVSRDVLLARVRAALRRAPTEISRARDEYRDDYVFINFAEVRVFVLGEEIHLTELEYRLLSVLAQHRGSVLTSDHLLDQCWGDRVTGPENVRVYIGYLRRKLREAGVDPDIIENVRGFGYRYVPENVAVNR